MGHTGEFELLVLLAILRLEEGAYGVTIREEVERETSRTLTLGAVYKTLGRLESNYKNRVAFHRQQIDQYIHHSHYNSLYDYW